MGKRNVLICNGGGPTAVINLTNMGIVEGCLDYGHGQARLYVALGGTGALIGEHATHDGKRHVADVTDLLADNHQRQLIKNTPSTWIGSGRYKLGADKGLRRCYGYDDTKDSKDPANVHAVQVATDYDITRVMEVVDELQVGHVFFVGGDDTLTTLNALADYVQRHPRPQWPTFLSVPKTIDNDLPDAVADPAPREEPEGILRSGNQIMVVDACPGFGTAANFVANEVAHLGVEAKALGRHYVIEIMGREAGFLTGAALLAQQFGYGPHLIAVPEHGPFDLEMFVSLIVARQEDQGWGVYCVSEGIRDADFEPLASHGVDAFGNAKLGGAGDLLVDHAMHHCGQRGLKVDVRSIKFGELQRVCSTSRSTADLEISYHVGHRAAYWALERKQTGKLVTIVREHSQTPTWRYGLVDTQLVSGRDKKRVMDARWVDTYEAYGLHVPTVNASYLEYVEPLTDPLVPIAAAYEGNELEL